METVSSTLRRTSTVPEVKPKEIVPEIIFNRKQNYLYRKAIIGVKGIPKGLLVHLSEEDKYEIDRFSRKVQRFLNIWKQEICIECTNNLFKKYFPNTNFTKSLISKFNNPDPKYFNTLDWKELGISKLLIADKLIQNGYLPENFYEL